MPHESLDATENLPDETPRQMGFNKFEGGVPGMPDEARTPSSPAAESY
jgi:hypothetical protein